MASVLEGNVGCPIVPCKEEEDLGRYFFVVVGSFAHGSMP